MPPKPNPAAAPANENKNFTVDIIVTKKNTEGTSVPGQISPRGPTSGIRLRTFSSWGENCLTTPIFGSDSLPWVVNPESQVASLVIQYKFDVELTDDDQLRAFHLDPGMYFLFTYITESSIKPVDLFHIDCSLTLMQETNYHLHRSIYDGMYNVEIKISNLKAIKTQESLIALEPIVFSVK